MHLNGLHVPADPNKARAYFARAAARGLAAGHTGLGVMAFEGAGGAARNLTAARAHFETAANGSNADAMFNLGNLHAHGGRSGVRSLREAEGAGTLQGPRLTLPPRSTPPDPVLIPHPTPTPSPGLGVPKDAARALKWYDKAYVAGHWRSPLALAMLYAEGERVGGLALGPAAGPCVAAAPALWRMPPRRGNGLNARIAVLMPPPPPPLTPRQGRHRL
jgi:TPR repeat protein